MSTAADMAQFMIAQLQQGSAGNPQILQPETLLTMHQPHFANDPRLPGWCYGFNQRWENGIQALEKGGEKPGYTSMMVLLPQQELGLFVTYNASRKELREQLVNQFFDRYFPPLIAPAPALTEIRQPDAQSFVGTYRYIRYPRRSLEKVELLLQFPDPLPELQVELHEGHLMLNGQTLIPSQPLLFEWQPGVTVAFRTEQQRITHLLIGTEAFEKLAWYEQRAFHLTVLAGCLLVFLVSVGWSIGTWLRPDAQPSALPQLSGWTAATAGLNLLFVVGLALSLRVINLYEFAFRVPPLILWLLWMPVLTTLLTGILLVTTVMVWRNSTWRNSTWSWQKHLFQALQMLALIGFSGFLHDWNLLGFRL